MFKKYLIGALAGIAVCAGLAFAATTYPGFQAVVGALVDQSTDAPVIVQSGQTISGQSGGANTGRWTATGTTTAAGTLTFPTAAPTVRECDFNDLTTPADRVVQSPTVSTTVVTIAGTIVSGDVISYSCMAH